MFKLVTAGSSGVPAAGVLIDEFEVHAVFLALPLLVIVLGLVFLAESQGVMRCAEYIRSKIESRYRPFIGWEEWLEEEGEQTDQKYRRLVNAWQLAAFYIVFLVYYAGASYLGVNNAHRIGEPEEIWELVASVLYVFLGVLFVWFLYLNLRATAADRSRSLPNFRLVRFRLIRFR